jgi:hypothetical protein
MVDIKQVKVIKLKRRVIMADFVKLSELVNSNFTVKKVWGYKFKMWDNDNRKMLVSDTWQKDYRKVYSVDTNKGSLDLSASQLGILLEAVVKNGVADLSGVTFQVKSNGKTGMDIRYFFNADSRVPKLEAPTEPVKPAEKEEVPFIDPKDEINLDDIPF